MSATIDCPPNTALRIDARTSQADGTNTVTVFLNGNQAMVARFAGRYFTGQNMADAANYSTGQAGVELACVNPDGTLTAVAGVLPSEAATAGPPLPAVAAGSLPFTGDHTAALAIAGVACVAIGAMLVRAAKRRAAAVYQPSTSAAWD